MAGAGPVRIATTMRMHGASMPLTAPCQRATSACASGPPRLTRACIVAQVYGMGSGLFFLGYSTFQVPSNLILRRVGGRVWLAFVVASWAIAATAFSGIKTTTQFYLLRYAPSPLPFFSCKERCQAGSSSACPAVQASGCFGPRA